MSEIPGATVDFTDYSAPNTPRILNIPDAVGDVTVQDVWDTLSAIAAKVENLPYKKLIDRPKSGGKIVLTASRKVGISLTGNNVRIKFPDQPGPSNVIKQVIDGNWIAQDHNGVKMEEMQSSNFTNWKNQADVSAAIVEPSSTFIKNQAFVGLTFTMVDEVTGQPVTGLSVTGTRSIDGVAFAALANAVTEIGTTGVYEIDLAGSDLNGDVITLRFTATGALDRVITIATAA